jgi:hypothetical protein
MDIKVLVIQSVSSREWKLFNISVKYCSFYAELNRHVC